MSLTRLQINNTDLLIGADRTSLTSDAAAAASTISVDSISRIAIDQILVIGEIGSENTEIIHTHSASAPSGSTVTLASNLTESHPRGTPVYVIQFNRYELSWSATATGTKTLLTTTLGTGLISIDAEADETTYYDSQYATGGYFYRKYNSITANFSEYSDYIIYTGNVHNSVGAIKQRALDQSGEKLGTKITDEMLTDALWEARRELDQERKRWSFRTSFNYDAGNVTEGQYRFASPSTLRDPDSGKNILGLRIGRSSNIRYVPKAEWDEYFYDVAHTTVGTAPSVGATSLVLTDSRDFDDSGSIQIAGNVITYTTNTRSTNTLSGIPASSTGSITVAHAAGVDVWQSIGFGLPSFYTVFEDYIYFSNPIDSTLEGRNVWMDYYRTMPEYDSDGDTLDEPYTDPFVSYLRWKIKYLKAKGDIKAESDSDYLDWVRGKERMIKNETLGQRVQFVPGNEHLDGAE